MMSAAILQTESIATLPSPLGEHRIETERLEMRAVSESDLDDYLGLMTDAAVMKYIGVEQGKIPSFEDVQTIVNGAVNAWNTRGYGRWSVFDRETGDFVGFCGFRCEGGLPELLSVVHERFWGNGYAREAAEAVLDYGFSQLGFSVVCSYVRPANRRARAVLEKIGAEFLGYVDFYGVEGAAYRIKPNLS